MPGRRNEDTLGLLGIRCLGAAVALGGCSDPLVMGSELIWVARHETEDLREWQTGERGGVLGPERLAEISGEHARSGRSSLRLSNPADRAEAGVCVWRAFEDLPEAYYSAWYLLPDAPVTESAWTLLRLRAPADADDTEVGAAGGGGAPSDGMVSLAWRSVIDLAMRSIPDGRLTLYVFSHDRDYLQLPLAVPPPLVPVGRWFHLEVFYRTTPEPTGRLAVWLDGEPVYGVADRPLGDGVHVAWALCNSGHAEGAEPATLYIDDAAVSRIRTSPSGAFDR